MEGKGQVGVKGGEAVEEVRASIQTLELGLGHSDNDNKAGE